MTKPIEGSVAVNSTPPLPPTSTTSSSSSSAASSRVHDEGGSHNTSKAPDKHRKSHSATAGVTPEKPNNLALERSVHNLDDDALRALLDEAITYKTPKDREGKSVLFNTMLSEAEDDLRKKQAYNASGPARHYSTTAKKRQRQRRQPSSISENRTHAGSLNDLVNEELYESTRMQRPKTVSTRPREGGSLPCNVNAGASLIDKQYFLEERVKQQEQRNKPREYGFGISSDIDSGKSHILENILQQGHRNNCDIVPVESFSARIPRVSNTYTTKASLQIDDGVKYHQLEQRNDATTRDVALRNTSPPMPSFLVGRDTIGHPRGVEKKLDENGNAVAGSSGHSLPPTSTTSLLKPRKLKYKKTSETVIEAENIEGHRADIIDNIDKLLSFIDGTEDKAKTKKLHKHSNSLNHEEKSKSSKRARKKSNSMLHKSNSMEEISTTKLEEFSCRFEPIDVKEKTPLRPTKSNAERQSRHNKTWVMSSEQLPIFPSSTSVENLEVSDFICVTKKKKSKKRRNSLNQPSSEARPADFHSLQVTSPRRKSASSAPHSEQSVDSSDNESVNSLPFDANNKNQQISYADIAKSSDKPKWNKPSSEKRKSEKAPVVHPTPNNRHEEKPTTITIVVNSKNADTNVVQPIEPKEVKVKETDTDLSSLQNWPEIRSNKVNNVKTNVNATPDNVHVHMHVQDWPVIISNTRHHQQQTVMTAAVAPTSVSTQTPPSKAPIIQTQIQSTPTTPYINKSADKNSTKTNKNYKFDVGCTNNLKNVKQVQTVPQPHVNHSKPPVVAIQQKELDLKEKPVIEDVVEDDQVVLNNTQQVIQQMSEQQQSMLYQYKMPPNIRDVQSIEKMQMRQAQAQLMSSTNANNNVSEDVDGEICAGRNMETSPPTNSEKHRPAVVILSSGADRHVSDITFGFGINEQLLKGDNYSVYADFMSRFYLPEVPTQSSWEIDTLVDYIGSGWQDVFVQTHTGKVKYYSDDPKFSD